jgi:hypothetical protein
LRERRSGGKGRKAIITLLTDFGTQDAYVAAVKGVILSINPAVTLVDLTHQVPPQDIAGAAFILGSSAFFFPEGTVHLAVVDPGVGTARRPLLLVTPRAAFVGPDNGVLTHVLGTASVGGGGPRLRGKPYDAPVPKGLRAYQLTNPRYWRHPVSSTFHARDIFGPVAAHLTLGVPPEEVGQPVETVKRLALPAVKRRKGGLLGHVIHVDRFGNLITNIPGNEVLGTTNDEPGRRVRIFIADRTILGLSQTYAAKEGFVAIVGSHGLVEVAVRDGSAAVLLGVGVGVPVWVDLQKEARRG